MKCQPSGLQKELISSGVTSVRAFPKSMNLFLIPSPQPRRSVLFGVLCLTFGLVFLVHAAAPSKPRYSRRVRFALNHTLTFPDFALRYTGQTHVKSPVFAPGFTYEHFVVEASGQTQEVIWCGGTGIPAPSVFTVGRRMFQLELHFSERRGALVPTELVISPGRHR